MARRLWGDLVGERPNERTPVSTLFALLLVAFVALALSACSLNPTQPGATPAPTATSTSQATEVSATVAPSPVANSGSTPQAAPTTAGPGPAATRAVQAPTIVTGAQPPAITPTSTPPPPTPAATPARVVTPSPNLTVVPGPTPPDSATPGPTSAALERFTAETQPYSIAYPTDWTVRPGGVESGDVRGDLFEAPVNEVSANVLSEEPAAGGPTTTEAYLAATIRAIEVGGSGPVVRLGTTPIAGGEAALIGWGDRSRPARTTEVTQAVWVSGGRGWVATLATPLGGRSEFLPTFQRMLVSFQPR